MITIETAVEFIKKNNSALLVLEDERQCLVFPDHIAWIQEVPWERMMEGGFCGVRRRCQSRIDGLQDRLQRGTEAWQTEIEGACGEIAVSRFTGLKWGCSVNKFKRGGDVGNWTQVRHSLNNRSDLIIRPRDPERKPWVLVTGCLGWYLIHGWFWGYEARVEEFEKWNDTKSPAWGVPQARLHPMDVFPNEPKNEVGVEVTESDLA